MIKENLNIGFVGAGRVAFQLAPKLANCGFAIRQVISRTKSRIEHLADLVGASFAHSIDELDHELDLVFLTVPDRELNNLFVELDHFPGILIHTSGTFSLSPRDDSHVRYGVIYPLQTFSHKRTLDWKNIPLFIEGSDPNVSLLLEELAKEISDVVVMLDSDHRKILHLAAVWANNFTNHMLQISQQVMERSDLPIHWMDPLIQETINKAMEMGVSEAQTGPAIRHDQTTINTHLDLLHWNQQIHDLYAYISQSIQTNSPIESSDT